MRTIIIYDRNNLQIDFVPETDQEKAILDMLKPGDTFEVGKASGYRKNTGGYLRAFEKPDDVKFTFIKREDVTDGGKHE